MTMSYEERCASYEKHLAAIAVNIIQVTEKVGLVSAIPMPYEMETQVFIDSCHSAMQRAIEMGISHLIIDFTNMSSIAAVQNIQAFGMVISSFKLIGISVTITGISPQVAMTAIQHGVELNGIRTYKNVSEALNNI